MVGARLATLEHGQRADHARAANLPVFEQDEAAEALNVSPRSIRSAAQSEKRETLMNSRHAICHSQSRMQLRPGLEREIRCMRFGEHRYLEVRAVIDGKAPRGATQARPEDAPILLEAVEQARHSTGEVDVGSFVDGRMMVEIKVARGAVRWQRYVDGQEAGVAIVFRAGPELDALEAAAEWLAS